MTQKLSRLDVETTTHVLTDELAAGEAGMTAFKTFMGGDTELSTSKYIPVHAVDHLTVHRTEAIISEEFIEALKAMTPVPAEAEVYGKTGKEFGSVVFDGKGGVSGTLNKVTGYTGFSNDPAQQDGYFLPFYYNGNEDIKFTVRNPEKVTADKGATGNVAFLGADIETARSAFLVINYKDEEIRIPMYGITFNE